MLRHSRDITRYQRHRWINKRKNYWLYKSWYEDGFLSKNKIIQHHRHCDICANYQKQKAAFNLKDE